jgi:hypothetical protein
VPNGVYHYFVYASGYSASPNEANLTVSGAPVTQAITFTAVVTYAVTFTEAGITPGSQWSVDLEGALNSTAAPGTNDFEVPAGTYGFVASATGYAASPAIGNVTVSTGPVSQKITFTPIPPPKLYNVLFSESGLPNGSAWGVAIMNDGPPIITGNFSCMSSGIGTELNCSVENGYYTWTVSSFVANYTATPMSGGLQIANAAASVSVTFSNTSTEFLLQFSEAQFAFLGTGGLPNGTSWSVTIGGSTQSTTGMLLFFLETNATTVSYVITPPSGFLVVPSSGNISGLANPFQSQFPTEASPFVNVVFVVSDPPVHGTSAAASQPSVLITFNERLAASASSRVES